MRPVSRPNQAGRARICVSLLLGAWQLLADANLTRLSSSRHHCVRLRYCSSALPTARFGYRSPRPVARMTVGWLLASVIGIALGAAIGSSRLARDLLDPTLEMSTSVVAGSRRYPSRHSVSWAIEQNVGSRHRLWRDLACLARKRAWLFLRPIGTDQRVTSARIWPLWDFLHKSPGFPLGASQTSSPACASASPFRVIYGGQPRCSVAAGVGLGIFSAQRFYRSADLYAGLIMLALLGFAANHLILLLEWRVLRWRDLRT